MSAAAFAVAGAFDPLLRAPAPAGALPPAEQREVLLTLARYQQVYQDFFARGGSPDLLDEFPATKEVRHQVFRDVGFLRDAGLLHVQDLARATLVETRWSGRDAAEAIVYEEWNHVLQKAEDRTPASPLAGAGQGVRYRLERSAGGWRVAGWDLVPVTPPAGEEDRPW